MARDIDFRYLEEDWRNKPKKVEKGYVNPRDAEYNTTLTGDYLFEHLVLTGKSRKEAYRIAYGDQDMQKAAFKEQVEELMEEGLPYWQARNQILKISDADSRRAWEARQKIYKPCTRCKATGIVEQYRHINNGQCFRCKGQKYV